MCKLMWACEISWVYMTNMHASQGYFVNGVPWRVRHPKSNFPASQADQSFPSFFYWRCRPRAIWYRFAKLQELTKQLSQGGHGLNHSFLGFSRHRAKLSRGPKGFPKCRFPPWNAKGVSSQTLIVPQGATALSGFIVGLPYPYSHRLEYACVPTGTFKWAWVPVCVARLWGGAPGALNPQVADPSTFWSQTLLIISQAFQWFSRHRAQTIFLDELPTSNHSQ